MRKMLKIFADFGPLVGFFVAYKAAGLIEATMVLIVLTAVSLGITFLMDRKIPLSPVITAAVVAFFGGLTIYLNDETFIKLKPTIVNLLFAAVLLGGLAFKKGLLKYVLGMAMRMEDAAWRTLSLRWGIFFLALAGLNELVWRNFDTDTWVNFKVFGLFGLVLLFTLTQVPFMQKHIQEDAPPEDSAP